MREHDRLGAAITTTREQFERPAALLLRRRHLGSETWYALLTRSRHASRANRGNFRDRAYAATPREPVASITSGASAPAA
jgi:hypothetical protein